MKGFDGGCFSSFCASLWSLQVSEVAVEEDGEEEEDDEDWGLG